MMRTICTRRSRTMRLGVPLLLALTSGCHDTTAFDADIRADFRTRVVGSDGAAVSGTVLRTVLVPTEHLQWPPHSESRKAGDIFARVELDDRRCYLVGPQASASIAEGVRLQGTVKVQLIEEWPLEVLSLDTPCLPLGDATIVGERRWEVIEHVIESEGADQPEP